jgi:hypothetical protein
LYWSWPGFVETANKDPDFPQKVITGDESWVYAYDPEAKAESHNGIRLCHHVRSRRGQVGATPRTWWRFLFVTKVLYTTSTLLPARQ